jgi:hypothetical protein
MWNKYQFTILIPRLLGVLSPLAAMRLDSESAFTVTRAEGLTGNKQNPKRVALRRWAWLCGLDATDRRFFGKPKPKRG